MKYLRRKSNKVFIMLGNACNMNCTYCLQHPLVHEPLKAGINPEIYDFLKEIKEENGGKLELVFYGGEPLLYLPTIKEIVENTECKYSVITNGKAITEEMVAFFNAHDIAVTVSWDGCRSMQTRGYDVFDDEKRKDLILRLNKLHLSGVISSLAYPLEILEDFQTINELYRQRHDHGIGVNLDEIMDTGIAGKELLSLDYDRVSEETEALARLYMEDKDRPEDYTKLVYIASFVKALQNFSEGEGKITASCGNGLTVLNMDLAGNLYPCHNTRERVGNIHTPFYKYLQRVLAGDITIADRQTCIRCAAYPYCRGGCKLVKDKSDYCRLKQAVFLPILHIFTEGVTPHDS